MNILGCLRLSLKKEIMGLSGLNISPLELRLKM